MSKKIKSEVLNLDIVVNGNKARKEMLDLKDTIEKETAGIKRMNDALNRMSKAGQEGSTRYRILKKTLDDTTASLEANKKRYKDLQQQIPITQKTIAELRKEIAITRDALAKAVPGTENWKRLNSQLQEQRTRLKQLTTQAEATDKSMCGLVKTVRDYSLAMQGVFAAMSKGYQYVEQATQAFTEYDEAVTDAMKTTNLTKEEVISISNELAKMDTRTAQNDLLGLVRVGGKLGISGKEDLLGFARAADQINVALGGDLGGDIEEVLGSVGKLVDIFQLQSEFGMEQAMLKLGSAINSLGMSSTANEGYIVNFSSQLAGIAPNVSIATSDILGMAAVMDKYNQRAETASTVIQQVILKMFSDTETFARIAGKSLDEFNTMLAVDTNAAFLAVLEGMNRYQGGIAEIANNLDDMNLRGSRAAGILGTLVANLDEVKRQQEIASASFAEGSSITEEAMTKNSSAAAQLEIAQKAVTAESVKLGEQMLPLKVAVTNTSAALLKLVGWVIEYRAAILTLVTGLTIAVKWKTTLAKIIGTITTLRKIDNATVKEGIIAAKSATAITNLLSAAKFALVGNLKMATVHMRAFNAALKANPIGAVITVVTLLTTAVVGLVTKLRNQKEVQKELTEAQKRTNQSMADAKNKIDQERRSLEDLQRALKNTKQGSQERRDLIKQINEKYGDYLPNLVSEKDSLNDIFTALKSVNDEFERKIYLQAMESDLANITENMVSHTKENLDALMKVWTDNGMEIPAETLAALTEAVTDYKAALETGADASEAYSRVMALVNSAGSTRAQTIRSEGRANAQRAYDAQVEMDGEGWEGVAWDSAEAIYQASDIDDFADRAAQSMSEAGTAAMAAYRSAIEAEMKDRQFVQDLYAGLIPSAPTIAGGSGGGGGGGSDDDDDKKSWSLSSDQAHQAALLALKEKYLKKEIATKEEYDKLVLKQEIKTLEARIALNADSAEEILDMQNDLADRRIRLSEMSGKKETTSTTTSQKTRLQIIEDHLKKEENEYLAARYRKEEMQRQEIAAFNGSAKEMRQMRRRHAKELAEIDLEHLKETSALLQKLINSDIKEFQKLDLGTKILSDSEYVALQKKLQEIIRLMNQAAAGKPTGGQSAPTQPEAETHSLTQGMGGGDLFGVSQEQWNQFFQNLEQGKFGAEGLGTAIQAIGGIAQKAMDIAYMAIDQVNAKEKAYLKQYEKDNEKKKKSLEKRLNAGLISEAQYNEEVEAMDKEYEAFAEELAVKQAKREKAMNLTQAIINTALGVTMTLAQWGVPWGLIPAGIMAAMGAAEIALIASTPITTGAEEGGEIFTKRKQDGKTFKARLSPDSRGFISSPTVIVGENGTEYVIPDEGVNNPTLRPFLYTLETARRNGTLRNIDFSSMYPAPMAGRAAGGYVSSPSALPAGSAGMISVQDPQLMAILREINEKLDNPVPAIVSMLGPKGFIEQLKKYNQNQRNSKLNG
ncbi:MAG: hypothetical protein IKA34_01455 [Bacteroidales bacterium]|nr:hypothetical protein [Bacteroidales bacterium]